VRPAAVSAIVGVLAAIVIVELVLNILYAFLLWRWWHAKAVILRRRSAPKDPYP
jgi:hypothetical protein